MLWLAPEYGFRDSHRDLAQALARRGIEVWQVNVVEALFLPQSTRSLRELDGDPIADLIVAAFDKSHKKVLVAGDSYAAANALSAAHAWQQRHYPQRYLIGAILFSPYTLAKIPPLGQAPEFLPIVAASNIPMLVLQANNSGIIGQFPLLLEQLRSQHSPVYISMLPDIMSLFYVVPATPAMKKLVEPVARRIRFSIPLLQQENLPMNPPPLVKREIGSNGIDITLTSFVGGHHPVPIDLYDINGKRVVKPSFKGKVTLVNFWATWCPPCVEEIPMLNRLMHKMKQQPFELISINYAEDKYEIERFMQKVKVHFPVLLDKNGQFAQQWNVVSYPSTFVIDKQGKIVYGVNAAIDWDSNEVWEKLRDLIGQ